jgi:hypothetical protein
MLNRTFQFLWSNKTCESEERVKTIYIYIKPPYGKETKLIKTGTSVADKFAMHMKTNFH